MNPNLPATTPATTTTTGRSRAGKALRPRARMATSRGSGAVVAAAADGAGDGPAKQRESPRQVVKPRPPAAERPPMMSRCRRATGVGQGRPRGTGPAQAARRAAAAMARNGGGGEAGPAARVAPVAEQHLASAGSLLAPAGSPPLASAGSGVARTIPGAVGVTSHRWRVATRMTTRGWSFSGSRRPPGIPMPDRGPRPRTTPCSSKAV